MPAADHRTVVVMVLAAALRGGGSGLGWFVSGMAGVLFEICIVCVSVLSVYLIDRCLVKLCRAHGGCLGTG